MNTTSVDTTPRLFSTYSTRVPRNKLIVWNFSLFLFHSMFAIITLYFGKIDLTVQVYKTQIGFSRRDINNTDAGWDLTPIYVEGGTFPITILTASFFVISAFFHLLNSSLLREYYLSELEKCRTPTRWIEYCFSAPLMILVISFTLGVRERCLLLSIMILVSITMPFGYWVEMVARPYNSMTWTKPFSTRILPWLIGNIPQVTAWFIIISQFYEYHHDLDRDSRSKVPWFVHFILWSELILFFSFGFASLLSQWGRPDQFYKGEVLFQILSLVSKGLLGMILLTSVLMLSSFEEIYS